MSVAIAAPPSGTLLQRLTGTEPKTVVQETSTTTISSVSGGGFDLKAGLRNGAIGAGIAGVLGGVSLLGKVALPLVGRIGSVAGLAKFAGVGGAIGLATAALPIVLPKLKESPAARSAAIGAAVGAAAGAVLPLLPIGVGAALGAGVGLLVHSRRTHPRPTYPMYPGYQASPGWVPYTGGMGVPVGMPMGMPAPYGASMTGYPVAPAMAGAGYPGAMVPQVGYGMALPMQAQGQATGQVVPQVAGQVAPQVAVAPQAGVAVPGMAGTAVPEAAPAPAPAPARAPKFSAKTFTDGSGNLRQVGTGKIIKPA